MEPEGEAENVFEYQSDSSEDEDVTCNGADGWLQALATCAPTDAYEPVEQIFEFSNESEDDHDDSHLAPHLAPESCCEEIWEELAVLPDYNDTNYPQEDRAYFRKQKEVNYVRNDKICLLQLFSYLKKENEDINFPTLRTKHASNINKALHC